jgi:5S rRNA maturation endonuclease (ribonuclease M5)
MRLDELLERLEGVKRSASGFVARCPAHDDHRQSLSIGEGDNGCILLTCFAGCETADVMAALGLGLADLYPEQERSNGKREIVATYDYTDEDGELLYQVVRFQPKDFRQRRPDGRGGWEWKLGRTRRVLYRLPELATAIATGESVYLVEGEKDADYLRRAGACATCNPGGAGKWSPDYSESLRGADVIIVADKDAPGRKHAESVAAALDGIAFAVHVVEPAEGKDAADHLAAGKGLDEFVPLSLEQAAATERSDSPFVDWGTFWQRDESDVEWVYQDVLARGRGHSIYAMHKAGKSLFTLYMAAQIATTGTACAAIYLDYEMTEADLYERLDEMGYGPDSDLSRLRYALLPTLPPLDTITGADALCAMVDSVEAELLGHHIVVVIDTISRAVCGEENSADTFRDFYRYTGIRLKQRGLTWVRLDHGGKSSEQGQRGSSSKGDDVDVVWKLAQTENGITMKRELSRMSWVPASVTFMQKDAPLRYLPMEYDWPAGTNETVILLDRCKVGLDAKYADAREKLVQAGVKRRRQVVLAALRWRRERAAEQFRNPGNPPEPAGNPSGTPHFGTPGNHPSGTVGTSLGNPPGTVGNRGLRQVGNRGGFLIREPPGPQPTPSDPSRRTSGEDLGFEY